MFCKAAQVCFFTKRGKFTILPCERGTGFTHEQVKFKFQLIHQGGFPILGFIANYRGFITRNHIEYQFSLRQPISAVLAL